MSDYDFILQDQQKRRGNSLLQGSFQRRLIGFVFIAIVLVVVIVLFSILLNSGKPSASAYLPVAIRQEELLRVLENRDDLSDQTLKPGYTTLFLAVTSDLQASNDYLAKNGVVISPEDRTPYYYFDLESDLEAAKSANRFDAELEAYVDKALADYSQTLLGLEPTTGQAPLLDQAKQNVIFYNGVPETESE